MRRSLLAALALSIPAAVLPIAGLASSLKVSGSTTMAAAVMMPMETQIEAASGVALDVVANGSGRGIADLVAGRSDLAMISAPLDVTMAKIEKKAPGTLKGADLRGHQIAETRVAFIVHASNPVTSMTRDQVAGILAGRITNWADLGGPDMPIVVVAESLGGGVRTLTERTLLGNGTVTATLREFPNATQVPIVVAQLAPAFGIAGIASAGAANVTVVALDAEISQPLILVSLGAPVGDVLRVIEASRAAGP